LLFSAVISEHISENRMIISVVAAKKKAYQKCVVFIGPPCTVSLSNCNTSHKWLQSGS